LESTKEPSGTDSNSKGGGEFREVKAGTGPRSWRIKGTLPQTRNRRVRTGEVAGVVFFGTS